MEMDLDLEKDLENVEKDMGMVDIDMGMVDIMPLDQ